MSEFFSTLPPQAMLVSFIVLALAIAVLAAFVFTRFLERRK
jgi:ABC-type antimicrobial peptide transport system permease subunit